MGRVSLAESVGSPIDGDGVTFVRQVVREPLSLPAGAFSCVFMSFSVPSREGLTKAALGPECWPSLLTTRLIVTTLDCVFEPLL